MNTPLWQFADEIPSSQPIFPVQVMEEAAERLMGDTDGLVIGKVTETVSTPFEDQSSKISYALYLMVPKLRNYLYRLIEVFAEGDIINPYPVTIRLYGRLPGNIAEERAQGLDEFKTKFMQAIQHPTTKMVLSAIRNQVDISNHY
jgi:hypothetical protein